MNKKEFDEWNQTIFLMLPDIFVQAIYGCLLQEIELSKDPEWVISTKIRKEWREDQL